MKRWQVILLFLLLAVAAGVAWSFVPARTSTTSTRTLGTYAYECDEHVGFNMTPSSDMQTIAIKPAHGAYPPASTLTVVPTNSGARYQGGGVVLVGHGEDIILGEGDDALNCAPVQAAGEAPFNFGD